MAVALCVSACAGEIGDDDTAAVDDGDELISMNLLSMNGMAAGMLPNNQMEQRPFNSESLKAANLADLSLINTAHGRQLIKYTALCALPPKSFVDVRPTRGKPVRYYGGLALAPEWEFDKLDVKGQRWVTACLLAHTNYFGVKVDISLTGVHPRLASTDAAELGEFTAHEACFYGNAFDNKDERVLRACMGSEWLIYSNGGAVSNYLEYRLCGLGVCNAKSNGYGSPDRLVSTMESDGDGIVPGAPTGMFARSGFHSPQRKAACTRDHLQSVRTGGTSDKHVAGTGCYIDLTDTAPAYDEVINVYLRKDDAKRMIEQCLKLGGCKTRG